MPHRPLHESNLGSDQQKIIDMLEDFDRSPLALYYDNCGDLKNDLRYHCMRCHSGDFDLWPGCVEEGVTFWDAIHGLDKIVFKGGDWINESSSL